MPLTIGILVIANSEFMKILQSNQICTVNNIRASSSLTISYGHKANRQFFRKNSDVTYLRSTLFPVIIILGFAFHANDLEESLRLHLGHTCAGRPRFLY